MEASESGGSNINPVETKRIRLKQSKSCATKEITVKQKDQPQQNAIILRKKIECILLKTKFSIILYFLIIKIPM